MTSPRLTLVRAGLTSAQDLGRSQGARHGFAAGGAMDQSAARRANVLVGNRQGAVLLENTATGLTCTLSTDTLIAVTGAARRLTVDGLPRPAGEPVVVPAGGTIAIGPAVLGLRTYLAVHGGLVVATLLGSAAPDPVLGFGRPLADGDTVELAGSFPALDHPHLRIPEFGIGRACPAPPHPTVPVIDVTDGPDRQEFGATAERIFAGRYVVGPQSNAIGLRMTGALPQRTTTAEVLSRGMPVGALEVPPGAELVVLHRGRGVTAGYPVLAVATSTGLDLLGQCRPGDEVRFRRVGIADAVTARRQGQARIDLLARRVRAAFAAIDRPLPDPIPAAPPTAAA
jgi:biotin-dependent carboxylase-like uncharacterized protein